jgi:hypothetical protein
VYSDAIVKFEQGAASHVGSEPWSWESERHVKLATELPGAYK